MKNRLTSLVIIVLAVLLFGGAAFGVSKFIKNYNAEPIPEPAQAVAYMIPQRTVYASEGEQVKLTVCAFSGCEISVKLGTLTFDGMEQFKAEGEYSIYYIDCSFPNNADEIRSIGNVKIVCLKDGEAFGYDGAAVEYSAHAQGSDELPTQVTQAQRVTGEASSVSEPQYAEEGTTGEYVEPKIKSKQMCVITSDRADCWPGDRTDDLLNPAYGSLTKGTYAYVEGTSTAYDSDANETRYFFDLQCGMRVLQSDCRLVDDQMNINAIQSTAALSNGRTIITIDESWHVPYKVNATPQRYFQMTNKLFNVSSFEAEKISFTFYYTEKASGSMDIKNSPVIKTAKWETDSAAQTATLTLTLKKVGAFYGYDAEYDTDGRLVISINRDQSSLSGAVILLDPGHGGNDSGALGMNGKVKESDINFAEAVALKSELESRGATVYLTRYGDEHYSIKQKRSNVYRYMPDLYLSIHSNAGEDSAAFGTSVYYYKPMSYALSSNIYESLTKAWATDIYKNNSVKVAGLARGCNFNPFAVTRLEECPSCLVELGFITNDEECALLCDAEIRATLAKAIADGAENALNSRK